MTLVASGLVLVMQPVAPMSPDRSEHYRSLTPLPPLSPGTELVQVITARADHLSQVLARFGTYGGVTGCRIDVEVADASGRALTSRPLPCSRIPDNCPVVVAELPRGAARAGDTLTVHFRAAPTDTESVVLWGGRPAEGPRAVLDGATLPGAAEVYTRYGSSGRLLDRLGEVSDRMSQYRPWWASAPATLVLLTTVVAGLVALVAVPRRARLPVLLLVVAAKGVLWSTLLPPLEVPDEPAHVAYAQYVAEEHAVPRRDHRGSGPSPYSDQVDTAVRVMNQTLRSPGDRPTFGPGTVGPDETRPDGESRRAPGGANPAAGYAPPYYVGAAVAYALPPGGFFTSLATMRLWSVALGVATIWLVVGIGRRLFAHDLAAIGLGLAVAFQPVWSQATSGVNNDAAVVLAGAACTLVALDLALRPDRARLPLVAGLVLGGALLTKPYATAMTGPLLVGWLLGRTDRTAPRRSWLADVGWAAAGVVVTFGTWLGISAALGIPMVTTDEAGVQAGHRTPGQYLARLTGHGYHALHLNWVERLWANLSWTDTPLPSPVVSAIAWATVGVLGLAVAWLLRTVVDLVRHRGRLDAEVCRETRAVVVLGTVVLSTLALLHTIELRWFLRTGDAALLSGRYALMTLPAVIGVVPLLVRRVLPRVPVGAPMLVITTAVIALNLVGVHTLLERFYL